MVRPFQFTRLPQIYFGPGMLNLLPGIISRYGREVLMIANEKSFTETILAGKLFDNLKRADIRFYIVNIPGEPSPDMIDSAAAKYRGHKIDVVIAIGGGSVMDAGKAISAMLTVKAPVKEFLEDVGIRNHPGSKLPFIAVPTTSGTGSEATKNAVLSKTGKGGFKKSLRHDNFVPEIALVDPELTLSCPRHITAASGMDCFSQLTEAYLSDRSCDYTDALALEGLRAVKENLKESYLDGMNLEARSGMSFAALTSGICLANAGLGVVHGFASSIGGMFDIPHGVVCGTLMASANEVTVDELRRSGNGKAALQKYAALGRIFVNKENASNDYYIDGFIDYLRNLTDHFSLPRLGFYGIGTKDINSLCLMTESKNNPVKLNYEALYKVLASRI